jgi:RNA processing factor Prp31
LMDNQCTEEQAAQEAAVDKRFVIQAIKIHDDLGKCIWIHSQTIRVAFEKYLTELSSLVCDDVTYSEVAL